jgi:hypothetical protein
MKDLFVSYEQAVQLKELGFDEPCLTFYNGKFLDSTEYDFDSCVSKDIGDCVLAPLKQQVFEWVRNKYGYHVSIRKRYFQNVAEVEYNYFIYPPNSNEHLEHNLLDEYDTWEEAESACIDDLIKLVKGDGTIDFICPDPNCPHCNYNE